jgi:hypothetical protein
MFSNVDDGLDANQRHRGLIYLDKPTNGAMAAYEDGFSVLDLCRKYYREAGLDIRRLNQLIR